MKATDDCQAKIRFWVADASKPGFRPPPCPVPETLPIFSPRRFSSYAELNEWKRRYLLEIARRGGVKWKGGRTVEADIPSGDVGPVPRSGANAAG